jgi:rhomboid family protein
VGIEGRDYMRAGGSPGSGPRRWSLTTRLLVANMALWFVFAGSRSWGGGSGGLYAFIRDVLLLHTDEVLGRLRVWQPFTAIWFHDPNGLGHLFFNMLFLFFFGPMAEDLLGARRMFSLYVLAGLACTLSLLPWAWITGVPAVGLGASGALYGLAVFLAFRRPRQPVVLLVFPMPLWVLVGVFLVGGELLGSVATGHASGATVGHLAGAATGWAYHLLRRPGVPAAPGPIARWRVRRARDRAQAEATRRVEDDARVDALLARIHAEGIDALSREEKDFLERASRRYGSPQ